MADTLTLFSKSGGYPQYTPIEPETFKIENTEFSFDLPKSYKENTIESLALTAKPVAQKSLQLTPIGTSSTVKPTAMAAVATTQPTLSVDTGKMKLSDEVIKKAQTPAEKAATYLNRAQIATGVESAAQIAQGVVTLANANAGLDAVERTARMRETNLAQTEALMYENMRDTIAQLDAVTAAKNVDLSSSATVGIKERGLSDLGKDVRTRQLAVKFQNAVDKYNAAQQKEAQVTQGILQVAQGVMTAAGLFI